MGHYIVVAAERLDYLLAILIDRDRLGQCAAATAPLVRQFVQGDRARFLTGVPRDSILIYPLLYGSRSCGIFSNHGVVFGPAQHCVGVWPLSCTAKPSLELDLLGCGELGALDFAIVRPSVVLDVLSMVAVDSVDAGCIY